MSQKRSHFFQKRRSGESDIELLVPCWQIFSENRRRRRRLGGAKPRSQQIGREDTRRTISRFSLPKHFVHMVRDCRSRTFRVDAPRLLCILGFPCLIGCAASPKRRSRNIESARETAAYFSTRSQRPLPMVPGKVASLATISSSKVPSWKARSRSAPTDAARKRASPSLRNSPKKRKTKNHPRLLVDEICSRKLRTCLFKKRCLPDHPRCETSLLGLLIRQRGHPVLAGPRGFK